jgi:hypothetical protein
MRTPLAAGSIVVLLAACYRYAPLTDLAPVDGAVVRLDLSDAGTARMGSVLGRNAIAVEGTILSRTDSSFLISVSATRQRDEQPLTWAGERVTVPRDAVQTIEARSLNKKKTLLVAGAAVLGAIGLKLIVSGLDALAGGGDGGITPPPPP